MRRSYPTNLQDKAVASLRRDALVVDALVACGELGVEEAFDEGLLSSADLVVLEEEGLLGEAALRRIVEAASEPRDRRGRWMALGGQRLVMSSPLMGYGQYPPRSQLVTGAALTDDEKAALSRHMLDPHANFALRGELQPGEHDERVVRHLDSAIGKSVVPAALVVYRGASADWFGGAEGLKALAEEAKKGHPLIDEPGYMSTSLSADAAEEFATIAKDAGGVPVRIRIGVPKGAHALPVGAHLPEHEMAPQDEVLIARGSQFRVDRVRRPTGKPVEVHLALVAQHAHNSALSEATPRILPRRRGAKPPVQPTDPGWDALHPRARGGLFARTQPKPAPAPKQRPAPARHVAQMTRIQVAQQRAERAAQRIALTQLAPAQLTDPVYSFQGGVSASYRGVAITIETGQDPRKVLARVVYFLDGMAPGARGQLTTLNAYTQPNPQDGYWQQQYRDPSFQSASDAAAAKKRIDVWRGGMATLDRGVFDHECGHLVQAAQDETYAAAQKSDAASSAAFRDKLARGHAANQLLGGQLLNALVGGLYVTRYAREGGPREDWPEAYSLWVADRRYGGLQTVYVKGRAVRVRFDDLWPARAAIFNARFA